MTTRAPETPSPEGGFIIIEVLVSAIILAIVAGAVLTLITATTRSAASGRDRAVAYDLAQEDQARLRTKQIPALNGLEQLNGKPIATPGAPIELNGTSYNVESRGVFVNNNAGGVSCTATNATPDYIQLTSTVTSSALNSPVTIQSVVSPSSGSINTTLGNLDINTMNAAEEPVSGISVSLEGTAYSRTTETQGCANFAELPAQNYKALIKSNGTLVNPEGKTQETLPVTVTGSQTKREPSWWDTPGTIRPEFVYLEPNTETLRPAPVDSMLVVPQTGGPPREFGRPGGPRSAGLTGGSLYPFKGTGYTVYAGSCVSNNPDPNSVKHENDVGLGSVEVPPGGTVPAPGSTVPFQIRVPALELTVESSTGEKLSGATVTVTDETCASGGELAKRTFTTNAGGHLSSATGATEAGLPFGTYKICASKTIGGKIRRGQLSKVSVENFSKTGTVKSVKLTEEPTTACS